MPGNLTSLIGRIAKRRKKRTDAQKRLATTDVLPPVQPKPLEHEPDRTKTQRLPKAESLQRQPLLIEVVSAIAVGPSPHVRPDLIGRTIAGGKKVRGATTTADVGLRSSPSGFANYGNVMKERRRKKKRKR